MRPHLSELGHSLAQHVRNNMGAIVLSSVSLAPVGIFALFDKPLDSPPPTPELKPTTALITDATPPPTRTPMPNPTPNAYGAFCLITDNAKPDTSKACSLPDGRTYWGPDAIVAGGPGDGIPMVSFLPQATPVANFGELFPDPNAVIASEGKANKGGYPIFYKPEGK